MDERVIFGEQATVLATKALDPLHVRMTLEAPHIAATARPGQFVNVVCGPTDLGTCVFDTWESFLDHRQMHQMERRFGGRLLRRPFAVHRLDISDRPARRFDILFKIVGKGTAALAEAAAGSKLDVLGPLGSGFNLRAAEEAHTAILVAGGVGLAPLYLLAQHLRARGREVYAFIGALDESQIPIETADSDVPLSFVESTEEVFLTSRDFERLGVKVGITTEQGRRGYRGYPTDLLAQYLTAYRSSALRNVRVYACGPWAMMRQAARIAETARVECEVLLEERMGCGVGACMACSVRVKRPDGAMAQKRICVDGPVFDAREVCWDER